MHQYCQNIIALAVVSISALTVMPCQAQTTAESNNNDTNKISPISTEPSIGINPTTPSEVNNSSSSTNNQPNILSENLSNPSTSVTVTTPETAQPSTRIPIGSRIFTVPTMEQ
ncbi:hypothetical protein NIES37_16180 [Tolypothrix tenuis PCC 7101]|uniref:Uncharacterized protein n=1 Tax=Tolypothrix tenuis PCC 7101 TaxID=231146 RepID=A0A1Z4MW35_9CYAN|nr:hypothetical protein [Aulosira sp. FACHB-113]BAY97674.1 hypothetical protein NIES37_16180 [Tolypothrix tenuis PCC 7101]BAZ71819.1 hypothetical protein NIES50_03660 [Aulosira laxa NIES-50]